MINVILIAAMVFGNFTNASALKTGNAQKARNNVDERIAEDLGGRPNRSSSEGYITRLEHQIYNQWLEDSKARNDKDRFINIPELVAKYGNLEEKFAVEIYVNSDNPFVDHPAIKDAVIYVVSPEAIFHVVSEYISAVKFGFAMFGSPKARTFADSLDRELKNITSEDERLNKLAGWHRESKKRFASERIGILKELKEWFDIEGDPVETAEWLSDFHNDAPAIPKEVKVTNRFILDHPALKTIYAIQRLSPYLAEQANKHNGVTIFNLRLSENKNGKRMSLNDLNRNLLSIINEAAVRNSQNISFLELFIPDNTSEEEVIKLLVQETGLNSDMRPARGAAKTGNENGDFIKNKIDAYYRAIKEEVGNYNFRLNGRASEAEAVNEFLAWVYLRPNVSNAHNVLFETLRESLELIDNNIKVPYLSLRFNTRRSDFNRGQTQNFYLRCISLGKTTFKETLKLLGHFDIALDEQEINKLMLKIDMIKNWQESSPYDTICKATASELSAALNKVSVRGVVGGEFDLPARGKILEDYKNIIASVIKNYPEQSGLGEDIAIKMDNLTVENISEGLQGIFIDYLKILHDANNKYISYQISLKEEQRYVGFPIVDAYRSLERGVMVYKVIEETCNMAVELGVNFSQADQKALLEQLAKLDKINKTAEAYKFFDFSFSRMAIGKMNALIGSARGAAEEIDGKNIETNPKAGDNKIKTQGETEKMHQDTLSFSDAKVGFSGAVAELATSDILSLVIVKKAKDLAGQGEAPKFTDPAQDEPVSRFGYKDVQGALRTKYIQGIVNWVKTTKGIGGKVLIHIGIGGQGLSNSSEVEYWGENGNSGDVIVLDRLGISVKKLFQDLIGKYGSIKNVAIDMSSKSGTTDEPAIIYQETLSEFLRLMAIDNAMGEDQASDFVVKLIKHFKEINNGKNGAQLFADINKDTFDAIEIKTVNDVFERMIFTTSANQASSRLYAFAMGLKKSGILNKDIAVFDFSEFTGGRFTQYCESGLTTLAWQGLPVIELNNILRQQILHYLGEDGNNPDKNSALRAAILAEKLNPKVIIVAVRASNSRYEALQKQQLFPESNGKNGMGSWVVVAAGEAELQRKIQDVRNQTGENPLVIVVDQEGFSSMKVPGEVPVIRYNKDDVSPFANAKFNLWFQEFTIRFGLLRSARMAVEHKLDLKIENVGAADMNNPEKSGFFWMFDAQNQPMVELAKGLLVKALNTISKTQEAIKGRYAQVEEKVKAGKFFDQIYLADPAGTRSLTVDQQDELLNKKLDGMKDVDKAEFKTIAPSSSNMLLDEIRKIQQENRSLAAQMKKEALTNKDQQPAIELQKQIENNDAALRKHYSGLAGVAENNLNNEAMQEAAKQLAALMLISKDRGRLLAPLFYTAEPNADILGAVLTSMGLADYGIGTTAQHANGQDRLDGSNATFNLLVDFVKPFAEVSSQQAQVDTFGLAKDELDGMFPDEVRRLFAEATYGALTGQASNKALGYDGKIYDKRFYRDAALMRLPDIAANEGLMDAVSIFYMAFKYFDDQNQNKINLNRNLVESQDIKDVRSAETRFFRYIDSGLIDFLKSAKDVKGAIIIDAETLLNNAGTLSVLSQIKENNPNIYTLIWAKTDAEWKALRQYSVNNNEALNIMFWHEPLKVMQEVKQASGVSYSDIVYISSDKEPFGEATLGIQRIKMDLPSISEDIAKLNVMPVIFANAITRLSPKELEERYKKFLEINLKNEKLTLSDDAHRAFAEINSAAVTIPLATTRSQEIIDAIKIFSRPI